MIVGHDSIRVLQPQRTGVGQPVESPHSGSSTEVEMGHRVQGSPAPLLLYQIPGVGEWEWKHGGMRNGRTDSCMR